MRIFFDRAHQRRQPQGSGRVGHRHPERCLRLGDVERFRHHGRFEGCQCLAHCWPQRFGARRGLDAVGGADQKFVTQAFTQSLDGI
jgi:hypothetical protein